MNPGYKQKDACEGYTVYSVPTRDSMPHQRAALINMEGSIIHEWSITGTPAVMLPGGSLIGNRRVSNISGAMDFVQEGWDGVIEWSFNRWDYVGSGVKRSRQHHDFQREGNPVGYYAPGQGFVEKGRTLILANKNKVVPEIKGDKELVDDVIYEVGWDGHLTGFEWHAADHFDDMGFDESAKKAIYVNEGDENDPERAMDWLHINSMASLGENPWHDKGDDRFNPANIIVGSRHANFIAIISRVTGKIVWRVGPDFSAGTSEQNIGQIIGQHHAHMIPNGLPGEGNILVFDNGGRSGYGGDDLFPRYPSRGYSRVVEFDPITLDRVWQYGTEKGEDRFYSHYISSAQRLPNGNTLINAGASGWIFEVTPDRKIVWEYTSNSEGERGNSVYRAYRVPPEWVPGNPAGYAEWMKTGVY